MTEPNRAETDEGKPTAEGATEPARPTTRELVGPSAPTSSSHPFAAAVNGQIFTVLFDAEHFRNGLAAAGVDAAGMDESALRALLVERGDELRVSPSPFFDEAFYIERHPDIAAGGLWGFEHFFTAGMDEGRWPHPLIDPTFIAADQGVGEHEALRTWLARQSAPNEIVWLGYRRWNDAPSVAQQRAIWRGLARHCSNAALAKRVLTYLPLLVEPGLAAGAGAWTMVERALGDRAHERLPSPFTPIPLARAPGTDGPTALIELLSVAPHRRWSPTPRLDMAFYDVRNPDLAPYDAELALHFLRHGQFEGRIGHPMFDGDWYRAHYGLAPGQSAHVHYAVSSARGYAMRSNSTCMAPIDYAVMAGVDVHRAMDEMAAAYSRTFAISVPSAMGDSAAPPGSRRADDEAVMAQIAAAAGLDPAIRPDQPNRALLPKPFDVGHAAPLERMRRMLAGCDVVLLRDHVTIGGADRVAGAMARVLGEAGYRVGVVATTRTPDHDAGAARYGGVAMVVLQDLLGHNDDVLVAELVYEAATLPDTRAVLAVSSGAALDVFTRFGRQVSSWAPIFVTYFCDDLDARGNADGYPARSFLPLIGTLAGVFTDTVHLRDELRGRVAPSVALAARVRALPTPYEPEGDMTPLPVELDAKGHRVAWAGRFDRQKRADLLPSIAAAMPDTAFDVWGKAVLDRSPFIDTPEHGLNLRGTYPSFAHVLARRPDAFLYTAAWDGAPTVLLDAVAAGLPIVATDVGGVRECLPPDYPYLVPADAGPDAYVATLRRLLANVEARGRETVTEGFNAVIAARTVEPFARGLLAAFRRAGVTPAEQWGWER